MEVLRQPVAKNPSELTLIDFVCLALGAVCPYHHRMDIVNYPPQYQQVGATGDCPHCRKPSNFSPVGGACIEYGNVRICQAVQCIGCHKFALVVGVRNAQNIPYKFSEFYPAGTYNDAVDANIPGNIAEDVKEALRCQFVTAHKAAVVMCRRAIQATCVEKKMADVKLQTQIDELAKQGLITEPLKQWAHEVRLGGNDGAHPDKDGLKDVTSQDAEEIIEFTTQFLNHIYVMPAALAQRQAARAAAKKTP